MARLSAARWGPIALLVVGGAYAGASIDWCPKPSTQPPGLRASAVAFGPLLAGTGKSDIVPPFPVVVAGYAPWRPDATGGNAAARALVLQTGEVRVGVVTVDLLTAPDALVGEARRQAAPLKLGALWVVATHTHSSLGAYEKNWVSQLAGTGRYREQAREAVLAAVSRALSEAAGSLKPAALQSGQSVAGDLVASRDPPEPVDARLTRFAFGDVAQWALFAAHPTLVPKGGRVLDPDYPGRLDALVTQAGVGNAKAVGASPAVFAQALAQRIAGTPVQPEPARLGFATVEVPLPRPDASRLVPWLFRGPGDNFLCASGAPRTAEVSALLLGSKVLLSVPGEPTAEVAEALEKAAGAARVVSVANGYLGYVELPDNVRARKGESRRQYFSPELEPVLERAAAAAGRALQGP